VTRRGSIDDSLKTPKPISGTKLTLGCSDGTHLETRAEHELRGIVTFAPV
jgi:hypothetical protein